MPKADDFQTARPFRPVREDGYPGSSALVPIGSHGRFAAGSTAAQTTITPPADAVAIMISATVAMGFYTLDGTTVANSGTHTGLVLPANSAPQVVLVSLGKPISLGVAINGTINYQWLTAV